ncbi:MAG TPA: LCP family protein [Candidatus Saccharimonadales bacterium]|nr:LCP family protein [Candidatus Saccharimonadales bacterium]
MDFQPRTPRSSIDGFISRSQPKSRRPTTRDTFTPVQRRSAVGFADSKTVAPKAPGQQQQAPFTNLYSSYRREQPKADKLRDRHRQPRVKRPRWKSLLLRSGLALLICAIVGGGWLGVRIVGDLDRVFHGSVFSDAQALFKNTQLNGEAQGRVTVLVAGDSSDRVDPATNGGNLTDSLMVLSVDTKHNTAFMLSIPRDLWVNVPGEGWAKINSTYEYDGMSGLSQLVSRDLGIPIDYYALVNYGAFEGLVNAVGGITVNIQSTDPRGLYDPQPYSGANAFYMSNGVHTINGAQALNLARARGDAFGSYGFPQGDFNRTKHQQQMVVAILQKAHSLGVLTNPVRIGQIFDTLGNSVQTNLNLADALAMARIAKNIPLGSIQSENYSYGGTSPLLVGYTAPNGEASLSPSAGVGDYSGLQHFYQQLSSTNAAVKENASVVVLNGSDVVGLAHTEASALQAKGLAVSSTGDASSEYPSSLIIDQSGGKDPATKQTLQQIFSSNTTITTTTTSSAEAGEASSYTSAQFIVVLGKNWDTMH